MNDLAKSALQDAVKRRLIRSVVIKDAKAYERLYKELQKGMTNAWSKAMREGIANALDRLRDLGPGKFTAEDGAAIMRVLETSVGEEAIRAAMREPVVSVSDALFRTGAEEVGQATGVAIAFMRPDLDALDILKQGNLYWVGNSWNTHTQDLFAAALDDYFTKGMTREDLTRRFAEDFASLSDRGQRYWELLADHTATKTREMGRVTGYERAGIEQVQVRAQLDEKTTPICRHMHGRIIAVKDMRAQRDTYLDAIGRRDEPTAKAAWAMHGAGTDFSNTPTSKIGKGTASPPYHFRCRTITVAFFGSADGEIGRWMRAAYSREKLPRKDVKALVERAQGAGWPHTKVSRGHYRKHAKRTGAATQDAYNASAVDLIRRGDRDVYVSVRKGKINATFAKPARNAMTGEEGFLVTAVDLEDNRITTHHWRTKMGTQRDEVPAQKQDAKGVMKWLFG
ncbi:hypothetical protein ACMA5I_06610 [Paracoccaceae bacterium GXU_MW_L88]